MKKGELEAFVTDVSEEIAEDMGFELVDVEYVKEGTSMFLRVYLDKEGGIGIDDCQAFSRRLSPILDEKDPVDENYFLEVSSPGLDRPLKKEKDFMRSIGKDVEIGTYAPVDGRKSFTGELIAFDDESVTIKEEDKEIKLLRKDISKINLAIVF